MNVEEVIKKAESDEGLTVKEIKVYQKAVKTMTKTMTPKQRARQKYEVVHKEEREQATKQFNTRLPSDEYEEIVAFLKKHGIPKVDLIRIGYGTLLENYKEIKQK